jgi:hypothetical protein
LLQTSHTWFLIPAWINLWFFKLPALDKFLLHTSHTCLLRDTAALWWLWDGPGWQKAGSAWCCFLFCNHSCEFIWLSSYTWFFAPAWINLRSFNVQPWVKALLQPSHTCFCLPSWMNLCPK